MEARLRKVEDDVVEVRERVVVLEERDRRVREDMKDLIQALEANTNEISKITRLTEKRGSFIAGAVFIIGAFGTVIAAILAFLQDWLFK